MFDDDAPFDSLRVSGGGQEHGVTRELVESVRAGDGDAWAALEDRYRDQLAVLVRGRLPKSMRSRFDTDDVLQTGIVAAFTRLDRFVDRGEGSFRRWLTTVVQNRLRDKLREHGAVQRDVGAEGQEDLAEHIALETGDVADAVERAEYIAAVIERLTELDEGQRELVRGYFLDEASVQELALNSDRSERSVRRDLARAVIRLRQMLKA